MDGRKTVYWICSKRKECRAKVTQSDSFESAYNASGLHKCLSQEYLQERTALITKVREVMLEATNLINNPQN